MKAGSSPRINAETLDGERWESDKITGLGRAWDEWSFVEGRRARWVEQLLELPSSSNYKGVSNDVAAHSRMNSSIDFHHDKHA